MGMFPTSTGDDVATLFGWGDSVSITAGDSVEAGDGVGDPDAGTVGVTEGVTVAVDVPGAVVGVTVAVEPGVGVVAGLGLGVGEHSATAFSNSFNKAGFLSKSWSEGHGTGGQILKSM